MGPKDAVEKKDCTWARTGGGSFTLKNTKGFEKIGPATTRALRAACGGKEKRVRRSDEDKRVKAVMQRDKHGTQWGEKIGRARKAKIKAEENPLGRKKHFHRKNKQ